MSITETSYTGEELIGGEIRSMRKTLTAATYYRGQLLGRVTASNKYAPYNSGASDGTEVARAICLRDEVIAADATREVYVNGTEVRAGGLVDGAGAKLTVTPAIIEALQDVGILVKEN